MSECLDTEPGGWGRLLRRALATGAPVLVHTPLGDTGVFDDVYVYELCVMLLPLATQQRIHRMRRALDAQQHLVLHLVQNAVVQTYLEFFVGACAVLAAPRFTHSRLGKPEVDWEHYQALSPTPIPRFTFSMSRCATGVGMLLSTNPTVQQVGLDYACTTDKLLDSAFDLAEYRDIFTACEYNRWDSVVMAQPPATRVLWFCQLWALKESFTKLLGVGLHTDLRLYEFGPMGLVDMAGLLHLDAPEAAFASVHTDHAAAATGTAGTGPAADNATSAAATFRPGWITPRAAVTNHSAPTELYTVDVGMVLSTIVAACVTDGSHLPPVAVACPLPFLVARNVP